MTLSAAAAILDAPLFGDDAGFDRVSIDSRGDCRGALYVALRGERFDGHRFIEAAVEAGAVGVVSAQPPRPGVATIAVDDTLRSLQSLAAAWRRRFPLPVVAITGSNGKTTVKTMVGSILSRHAETLVSEGNFNNHIGVPLSLLRIRDQHRYAVIEMGMNHPGELELLSGLAAPNVALINNAAAAHLEGVGSVEGVARAKAEIFRGLGADGIAVVNGDDPFAPYWMGLNEGRRCLSFGLGADCDICGSARADIDGTDLEIRYPGATVRVRLVAPGMHNARNALAAAAVAAALEIPAHCVVAGLERFTAVKGRGQRETLGRVTVINDVYNANPASLAAAIELLAAHPGRRVLVLGDMAELGPEAESLHRAAGRSARDAGINRLLGLGPLSRSACAAFGRPADAFEDIDAVVGELAAEAGAPVTVLVKGSRSMRMERVVEGLREHTAKEGGR